MSAVAIATVLGAVSCTSGSSGTTSTGTTVGSGPLTKAQLIEKADAICGAAATRQAEIATPKTAAEVPAYLDGNLRVAKDQLAAIKALGEPTDDAAAYRVAFGKQAAFVEALEQKMPAYRRDPELIVKDTELTAANNVANHAARDYGFKECGKSLGSSGSSGSSGPGGSDGPGTTTPAG